MKIKKMAAIGLTTTAAMGIFAIGCGPDRSREDAHDVTQSCQQAGAIPDFGCVDKSVPGVVAFNNKFPNLEFKCIGQTGYMSLERSNGDQKILPEPNCPGYVKGEMPTAIIVTDNK